MNKEKHNRIYLEEKQAEEYFNHIQTHPINVSEQKLLKALFPKLTNKNCLEIGCAGAIYSRKMLKKGALKVDSLDYSPSMIKMAKSLTKNKVSYYLKDINFPIILEGTYDFICASYILHYSKKLAQTLPSIIELLNTKGILIFSVPNPQEFQQGENQLLLGEKKVITHFFNHSQETYLDILKKSGEILELQKNTDVFIVKFQKT